MTELDKRAILVGAFPPPVHGASLVNLSYHKFLLSKSTLQIMVLDLSPGRSKGIWIRKLLRMPKIMASFGRFFWICILEKPDFLYLGASGGLGQCYEMAFLLLARIFGINSAIHHHSFLYLDSPKWHAALMIMAAGPRARHLTLCPGMRAQLIRNYGPLGGVESISNAWVIAPEMMSEVPRPMVGTIGFLGNISEEKGILEFLEVAERCDSRGIRALLAGPFQNNAIASVVLSRLKRSKNICYVGPKYGADKQAFFNDLDVLVFPSKYVHEAEPLTILEAMANGVPVVAIDRGCIDCLLPDSAGYLIARRDNFSDLATKKIFEWLEEPNVYRTVAQGARAHFEALRRRSIEDLETITNGLLVSEEG